MISESWMTTEEAAAKIGNTPKTIRRWIRKGVRGRTLPATFTGLGYKICPATLQTYLREMTYQQLEPQVMQDQGGK